MKYLECIVCGSSEHLVPPSGPNEMWTCGLCGFKFRVTPKDAEKIWKRAEAEGIDLDRYEPYIVRLLVNK